MAKDFRSLTTSALGEDGTPRRRRPVEYGSALDIILPDTDNIQELCRAATPHTTRRLIEIALDPNEDAKNALTAIKEIHDRAHGKPTQTIEGTMTIEHIDRTIAALEKKMQEEGIDLEPIEMEAVDEIID